MPSICQVTPFEGFAVYKLWSYRRSVRMFCDWEEVHGRSHTTSFSPAAEQGQAQGTVSTSVPLHIFAYSENVEGK